MKLRETFLPVLRPFSGDEEKRAISETLDSGWWGKGEKVRLFEERFAESVGARYAIAVSSATAGQDLVVKALGIREGEIISPTLSFVTTGVVPLWNGCRSRLVDVSYDSLNISCNAVAQALNADTQAVIAVNYSGILADIATIRSHFKGFILEDCAHSAIVPGAGTLSDAAVWSFQAVKTLPTGDGGMITLNDPDLYEKLRRMTWLGISSTHERMSSSPSGSPGYSWDYEVRELGYKAYMTDLTAAIGLVQLDKLEGHLTRRREIQAAYNSRLPAEVQRPMWSHTVQHYSARVPMWSRNLLMTFLADKRIHTSVHYKPLHLHPLLSQPGPFPVADVEWQRLVTLPCHPSMTDEDIDYVVYWVNEFFESHEGSQPQT